MSLSISLSFPLPPLPPYPFPFPCPFPSTSPSPPVPGYWEFKVDGVTASAPTNSEIKLFYENENKTTPILTPLKSAQTGRSVVG